MDDTALKEALKRLLSTGEAASDAKMVRMANAKKAPPPQAQEMCPECHKPMLDGKCPACGYETPKPDGGGDDLASMLELGAKG